MEEKEILEEFVTNNALDIDAIINKYYNYVYTIVKNGVSVAITDEDIEEIISDVFLGLWKNSSKLDKTMVIKPYLVGITKNVIKNKYRTTKINFSITDYEEELIDLTDIEKLYEDKEQNKIVIDTLKGMKDEEYKIFIMFYYNNKKIKDIAKELKITESKVKVTLHRVRKIIKKNLKNGGYSYGKQ